MSAIQSIIEAHPRNPENIEAIIRAVEAVYECAAVCTICADACESEKHPAHLHDCIRLDLECAAVCIAAGTLIARIARSGAQPMQAQLATCVVACRTCEEECRRHAAMHEHCRICAETCRHCADLCERLMTTFRHAGDTSPERWARGTL